MSIMDFCTSFFISNGLWPLDASLRLKMLRVPYKKIVKLTFPCFGTWSNTLVRLMDNVVLYRMLLFTMPILVYVSTWTEGLFMYFFRCIAYLV